MITKAVTLTSTPTAITAIAGLKESNIQIWSNQVLEFQSPGDDLVVLSPNTVLPLPDTGALNTLLFKGAGTLYIVIHD